MIIINLLVCILYITVPAAITQCYPVYQTVTVLNSTMITCHAKGYPAPTLYWMLSDKVVKNDSNNTIVSYENCSSSGNDSSCESSSTLYIKHTLSFHNGTYSCVAINSAGNDTKSVELSVKGMFC